MQKIKATTKRAIRELFTFITFAVAVTIIPAIGFFVLDVSAQVETQGQLLAVIILALTWTAALLSMHRWTR
jgi:hypothetical protein